MEYRTKAELEAVATVAPVETTRAPKPMTRRQKLERWAEVLLKYQYTRVRMLRDTEYVDEVDRRALRGEHSPISVAYADPVLRAQGLKGDTYGDAADFFQISDDYLHLAVCWCHRGDLVSTRDAARMVTAIALKMPKTDNRNRISTIVFAIGVSGGLTVLAALSGYSLIHM